VGAAYAIKLAQVDLAEAERRGAEVFSQMLDG
jgi:hypothetical protein